MNSRIPSRRLGQSALAALQPRTSRWIPANPLTIASRRNASNPSKPTEEANTTLKSEETDLTNPVLEQYLQQREKDNSASREQSQGIRLRTGGMNRSPNALFTPELDVPGWDPKLPQEKLQELKDKVKAQQAAAKAAMDKEHHSLVLDPDPLARRKLEARLVIRGVKRRGRLTKAENIARTERQSLYKSHALPTSTKKMQKVMNQIAGKSVSEALVQLRFSPKRIARDVMKGLEIAQNEAIAVRGMGLGGGKVAQKRWENQRNQTEVPGQQKATIASIRKANAEQQSKKSGSAVIELKDGGKKLVRDPSEIYIDQAWVGKGEMWKSQEFRARGRVNLLRHRTTSFTVLLKEEKTRMRISDEIKKKRDNRKLWVALPDRPVTSQRQYCLW